MSVVRNKASLDLINHKSMSFQSQLPCQERVCGLFAAFESAVTRFANMPQLQHTLRMLFALN